jgi:hypothetical protein
MGARHPGSEGIAFLVGSFPPCNRHISPEKHTASLDSAALGCYSRKLTPPDRKLDVKVVQTLIEGAAGRREHGVVAAMGQQR